MKITALLLFIGFLHVSAASLSQTVNLQAKNKSLTEVLSVIKQQTGYLVIYNNRYVKEVGNVSVTAKNMSLDNFLSEVLKNTGLTYIINQKSILIKKVEEDKKTLNANKQGEVFSQQKIITGKITDPKGEPLVGVSVKVKNIQASTVTDVNGNYKITVPNKEAILIFSYLGFTPQEIKAGENKTINIKLIEEVSKLKEVVLVGYGEVRRGDLTGAVSSVDLESFEKAPVKSFDDALAGRVAGVQVYGNDGQPGESNNIIIRGGNSLTQDNSPLYVIDGFPTEFFDMNSLIQSDIASIEILKDASATAIYGSRGANGVVVITTKIGKNERAKINYSFNHGYQKNKNHFDLLSPYEFVKYQLELNSAKATDMYLSDRFLEYYKDMKGTDFQDLIFRTAMANNHELSVRGGNRNTSYSVSGNIYDQEGIMINTGFGRKSTRVNYTTKLRDNLKLYAGGNFSKTETQGNVASETSAGLPSLYIMYSMIGYRPVAGKSNLDLENSFFDDDIDMVAVGDYRVNPYISLKNEYNLRTSKTINLNSYLEYQPSKKITIKSLVGYSGNNRGQEIFNNSQTRLGNIVSFPSSIGINGSLFNGENTNWVNENTITYRSQFKKNKIDALAGFTIQENKYRYWGYTAGFLSSDNLGIDALDQSRSITPIVRSEEWGLLSYLARVNYSFKDKYLATANFRADGSSKFPNNKWGYFPSVALAWKINQEEFMRNISIISESKIRTGYGVTGNNRVRPYDAYSSLTYDQFSYYSFNNQTPSKGAILGELGNPNLRWEVTRQMNIGYDFGIMNQRFTATVDLYRKVTDNLLLNADLPYYSGYVNAMKNVGRISNRGLEITLGAYPIRTQHFQWKSDFNISFNKTKVLALNEDQTVLTKKVSFAGDYSALPTYQAHIGQSPSDMYGVIFDGLYQVDDFVLDNGIYTLRPGTSDNGNINVQPGDIKFRDINGDKTINAEDFVKIGRGLPKHIGGFSNTLRYKNFEFNVLFQWSYGNDVINANRLYFEENAYNLFSFNQYASVANRWTPDNTNTHIPRANSVKPKYIHSNVVEDASYLRLKTVYLSYQFDKLKFIKNENPRIRVFLSAQNLYTWTSYSGADPEVSVRNSTLTAGLDFSSYPRPFFLNMGVNLNF